MKYDIDTDECRFDHVQIANITVGRLDRIAGCPAPFFSGERADLPTLVQQKADEPGTKKSICASYQGFHEIVPGWSCESGMRIRGEPNCTRQEIRSQSVAEGFSGFSPSKRTQ